AARIAYAKLAPITAHKTLRSKPLAGSRSAPVRSVQSVPANEMALHEVQKDAPPPMVQGAPVAVTASGTKNGMVLVMVVVFLLVAAAVFFLWKKMGPNP